MSISIFILFLCGACLVWMGTIKVSIDKKELWQWGVFAYSMGIVFITIALTRVV